VINENGLHEKTSLKRNVSIFISVTAVVSPGSPNGIDNWERIDLSYDGFNEDNDSASISSPP